MCIYLSLSGTYTASIVIAYKYFTTFTVVNFTSLSTLLSRPAREGRVRTKG